jgi:sigma-B regulation protein RsbU (phosphoserine phosphatase)
MAYRKRGVDRRRFTGDATFPVHLPSGDTVAEERRSGNDRRSLGMLGGLPMFQGIPFSAIEAAYPHCEERRLDTGEQLLSPGVDNQYLFLLLEGRLSVHIDSPDHESQIQIAPGECVGEVSIIDGGDVTAWVIAAEPCRLLAIPERQLWSEITRHPGVARNLMRQSAERFRARNELMQQAIEDRLRYEALQKELAIATEIQCSMLPHDFALADGFDIHAGMAAARHVGGDFYDAFRIDDDHIYVAIGDVAGKGVPAALFVVRAMTLLRIEMLKRQPVEIAVAAVNRALCRNNDRYLFVTLAVVVIDTQSGRCLYVSAGHNPVALGRAGAGFEFLEPADGILAGVEDSAVYQARELQLDVGDVLFLYTDGVTEAMTPGRELFGEQRLIATLNASPDRQSQSLTQAMAKSVEDFADGAPQSDDLTLLAVRRAA